MLRIKGDDAKRWTTALVIYAKLRGSSAAQVAREIIEKEIGEELRTIMDDSSFFAPDVASIEHNALLTEQDS